MISIAGCVAPFISADWFIEEQIDSTHILQHNDNARLVALQLGNAYGLLFMLGVAVLYTTTELKVVRNYVEIWWVASESLRRCINRGSMVAIAAFSVDI